MNNLIIAALTFIMLPAFANTTTAKNNKNCKVEKNEIIVEKINFTDDFLDFTKSDDDVTTVEVDYIIEESGKPYITYINSDSHNAKNEVVKFIESASYNINPVQGKVYSMQLIMKK